MEELGKNFIAHRVGQAQREAVATIAAWDQDPANAGKYVARAYNTLLKGTGDKVVGTSWMPGGPGTGPGEGVMLLDIQTPDGEVRQQPATRGDLIYSAQILMDPERGTKVIQDMSSGVRAAD